MSDDEFQPVDTDTASETYPLQCSALRENGYVCMQNRPCKIVEMSTSTSGKHGHAKVHLIALDIFTGEKYEDIFPSTYTIDVPYVSRKDFQVTDIINGYLELIEDDGELRDEVKLPDGDLGKEIQTKFENTDSFLVTVLKAMGEESVIAIKNVEK